MLLNIWIFPHVSYNLPWMDIYTSGAAYLKMFPLQVSVSCQADKLS